jgi:hypothetical protein
LDPNPTVVLEKIENPPVPLMNIPPVVDCWITDILLPEKEVDADGRIEESPVDPLERNVVENREFVEKEDSDLKVNADDDPEVVQ